MKPITYAEFDPLTRLHFALFVERVFAEVEPGKLYLDNFHMHVIYEALEDLDAHAPALLIESSAVARAVVANAAMHLELLIVGGGIEDGDFHTEPVREAIRGALERDWENYIRQILAKPTHLHGGARSQRRCDHAAYALE